MINPISVIILCLNNNIEELEKTIKSICYNTYEVIVVTLNINPEKLISLYNILESVPYRWQIDSLKEEDINRILPIFIINYTYRLLHTDWFIVLNAGDIITQDEWTSIYEHTKDSKVKLGYFDLNNELKLLLSKYIYNIVGGSTEEASCFTKVKKLEDWKSLCFQIK